MSQPVPAALLELPLGLRLMRKLAFPRKLGVLERLFGARLAPSGIAWVKTAVGAHWKLDLADASHRWIVYGDYEGGAQMKWIMQWVGKGDTVIDSGSNIGQMLLYFAFVAHARVLAFEPLPSARSWLVECLQQYPQWDVTLRDCGLSERPQKIMLQMDGARSTTRKDWYVARELESVEIRCEPLDDVLAASDEPIRLWKLDVEGAEASALRGARRCLSTRRIQAVLVEACAERFDELRQCFDNVEFLLYKISKDGRLRKVLSASDVGHGNLVALPAEASAVPS